MLRLAKGWQGREVEKGEGRQRSKSGDISLGKEGRWRSEERVMAGKGIEKKKRRKAEKIKETE